MFSSDGAAVVKDFALRGNHDIHLNWWVDEGRRGRPLTAEGSPIVLFMPMALPRVPVTLNHSHEIP
jgi:hypothetical protein